MADQRAMAAIKLTEAEIKARVLTELRQQAAISKKAVIANEFRIGNSSIRADLAILTNEFIGIEIKSEFDSLRRLASQTGAYLSYFDRVIVVLASKHLKKVNPSVLVGVELWEVNEDGKFSTLSVPAKNPMVEKKSLFDLMTQQEKRRFCDTEAVLPLEIDPWESCSDDRRSFCAAFRNRFERTSRDFWQAVGRRAIHATDLSRLSRFHELRQGRIKWSEMQTAMWREWQQRAESVFAQPAEAEFSPAILRLCYTPQSDHHKTADGANECLSGQL